jgi:hypothetical protein
MLLFALFCVLDIAGMQYGMRLVHTAPTHPEPRLGQIVEMVNRAGGLSSPVYITSVEAAVFYGLLGAGAAALLTTLGLIVAHGIRLTWVPRK